MKIFFTILLLVFSSFVFGEEKKFILEGHSINFDIPPGWESVKDLFGMPLVVLGPEVQGSRPAVMFLCTNLTVGKVPRPELHKLFTGLKEEKSKWIKTHKGELLSFQGPTDVKLRENLTGQFLNAEFKINGTQFIERSYYLYCKDVIYNVKYSARAEHSQYLPVIQSFIGTLQCEN